MTTSTAPGRAVSAAVRPTQPLPYAQRVDAALARGVDLAKADPSSLRRPELEVHLHELQRLILGRAFPMRRLEAAGFSSGVSPSFQALPPDRQQALMGAYGDAIQLLSRVGPQTFGDRMDGVSSILSFSAGRVSSDGEVIDIGAELFAAAQGKVASAKLDPKLELNLMERMDSGAFDSFTVAVTLEKPQRVTVQALLDLDNSRLYLVDRSKDPSNPTVSRITDTAFERRIASAWSQRVLPTVTAYRRQADGFA